MSLGKLRTIFGDYPSIGFLSIFYAIMESPLAIWEKQERKGEIKRSVDEDRYAALELYTESNLYLTYITSPCHQFSSLGIKLPHLVLIVKNVYKNFAFTIQVRDQLCKRRFLFNSSYRTTRIKSHSAHIPILLQKNWTELEIDLAALTRKAYGTVYEETVRVQIYANCRLRMIYFSAAPLEIPQVSEMMKGILSSVTESTKRDLALSKSSTSVHGVPPAYLLIPSGPGGQLLHAQLPLIEDCIEMSLEWREIFSTMKIMNAVSETKTKSEMDRVEIGHVRSSSEEQLEEEVEEFIDGLLSNFGYDDLEQIDGLLHQNSNDVEVEENLNILDSKCSESMISVLESLEDTKDDKKSINENSYKVITIRPVAYEVEPSNYNLDFKERRPAHEEIIESNRSTESFHMESLYKITDEQNMNWEQDESLKLLDSQLVEIEETLKEIELTRACGLKSTTSAPAFVVTRSSSLVNQMRNKIEEMKRKINKLEAEFNQSQTSLSSTMLPSNYNLAGRNGKLNFSLSSPCTPASKNPSVGILRLPGTPPSSEKLRQKLSVRFSEIIEEGINSDHFYSESLDELTEEAGTSQSIRKKELCPDCIRFLGSFPMMPGSSRPNTL